MQYDLYPLMQILEIEKLLKDNMEKQFEKWDEKCCDFNACNKTFTRRQVMRDS